MSYSFSCQAESKALLIDQIGVQLDKVVEAQEVHSADREQALAAATAFVDLLQDDDSQDFSITMSGSILRTETGVQNAGVIVSAALVKKAT